ncbi:MAG: 4-hydroxy-tetrahydrodipicolinate synthase [Phycisphaerae bacterium]|nr:4-hydroxy-tetrahydrodipicolinate synthase [Phycisphaerae bacterium]NUQ46674.1 4-hydroxy-tetrahydrodipicolinate synthase [Phycisphaerae bacterium]
MIKGCYVALVTPFRDGQVDLSALEALVDRLVAAGVDGLVPCGTTGESPALSDDEHAAVVAAVVRRARGRARVVAGTGTNCTDKTLRLSRRALEAGADGLMLVSPYYNKPTQEGLVRHFSTIARESSAPIMLYNIPGRTGVEIAPATLARLRSEHRNIVAVKHATGNVDGVSELSLMTDLAILSGDDPLTLPMMSVGAVGVVSVIGNLVPSDVKGLTDAALRGDWQVALRLHRKTWRLARALLTLETNPIPIKTALAIRGLIAEEFRLPMCPMSAENKSRLSAILQEVPA